MIIDREKQLEIFGTTLIELIRIIEEDFGGDRSRAAGAFLRDAGELARKQDFQKCDQLIACAKYAIKEVFEIREIKADLAERNDLEFSAKGGTGK